MRPAYCICSRNFSGRPAVFEWSFDCPTIATDSGANSASRNVLMSLGRFRPAWRPLIEAAVEHVLGDAVLQHLDRAAGDHPAAAAPHAVLDQRLAAVAERAHRLYRLMRDLEAGLVAGGLRHRGLVGGGEPAVGVHGG